MSSIDTGHKAEQAAANYLEMRGFKVLELNWRRPHCEVDIIASKDRVVYFVEVKYRRTNNQGGGLDYVTNSKLQRMRRGAQSWVEENKYSGEHQLAAIEVAGRDFVVEHFIDNVL
jgi:putative endonuclease